MTIPKIPQRTGKVIMAPNAIAVPALRPIVNRSAISPPIE